MQNGKSKDWVLFPYDASNEKAIKIDFSGNTLLANGEKGTLLGSKGTSKDGNTKFIRILLIDIFFVGNIDLMKRDKLAAPISVLIEII